MALAKHWVLQVQQLIGIMLRLVMILSWNHTLGLGMLQTAAPAGLSHPTSSGSTPFAGYITHHVPGSKLNCDAYIFTTAHLPASLSAQDSYTAVRCSQHAVDG